MFANWLDNLRIVQSVNYKKLHSLEERSLQVWLALEQFFFLPTGITQFVFVPQNGVQKERSKYENDGDNYLN